MCNYAENVNTHKQVNMSSYEDVVLLKDELGVVYDDDMVHSFIAPESHYLIYLKNYRWNNTSGYKVVDNASDVFYRGFECNINMSDVSKDGKILRCFESCHDKPTGYISYIIGLSPKEYDRLLYNKGRLSDYEYIERLIRKSA